MDKNPLKFRGHREGDPKKLKTEVQNINKATVCQEKLLEKSLRWSYIDLHLVSNYFMITRIKTLLYITIFKLFTFRGCHRDLSPRPGRQQPVAVTHHLHGHDIIPRYFSVSVFHNRLHLLYHVISNISSFYLIYILRCKNKKTFTV